MRMLDLVTPNYTTKSDTTNQIPAFSLHSSVKKNSKQLAYLLFTPSFSRNTPKPLPLQTLLSLYLDLISWHHMYQVKPKEKKLKDIFKC